MLDYTRGSAPAIPHQFIERRDVRQSHIRIVYPMARVGWVRLRRIVFKVDARQLALRFSEDVVLVGFIVSARLI